MQDKKRIIVNVHIEKTAGTSLLRFFELTLGKDRVAFYDPKSDSIIKVSDLIISPSNNFVDMHQLKSYAFWPIAKNLVFFIQQKRRRKNGVPKDVAIIHGHFTANRFIDVVPNAINTIVVRDPLSRMHSQYDHWKRAKGRSQWRVMIPFDDSMSFEDYALLPELRNYQVNACAGKDLSSFDVVGLTENLEAFTKNIYSLLISQQHINTSMPFVGLSDMNKYRNNHEIKRSGFEQAFYAFHKDDYDLYKQAKTIEVNTYDSKSKSPKKIKIDSLFSDSRESKSIFV